MKSTGFNAVNLTMSIFGLVKTVAVDACLRFAAHPGEAGFENTTHASSLSDRAAKIYRRWPVIPDLMPDDREQRHENERCCTATMMVESPSRLSCSRQTSAYKESENCEHTAQLG